MAEIEIGAPEDGGGGPLGGIPKKWLLIGAGGVGLALLFVFQRRGGGGAAEETANGSFTGLGPNAAVALGSMQTDLRQQSGLIQEQMRDYFTDVTELLGGLSGSGAQQLDLLGGLRDDLNAGFASQNEGLTSAVDELLGGISGGFGQLGSQVSGGFGQLGAQLQANAAQANEWGSLLALMAQQNQDLQRHYGEFSRSRLFYGLPFTDDMAMGAVG